MAERQQKPIGQEFRCRRCGACCRIKDGIVRGEMPRRALRLVYEWLDLHRDELMENWERLSNSEVAKKIEPLK